MSNIKIVKDLKGKEVENICEDANGCANCPLIISSYHKNIHCIRDDEVEMYEVEKVYQLLNSKIDLDTNKIIKED